MKTIGLVTTSRADFGIYLPVARELKKSNKIKFFFIVTGSHLSALYGLTIREIEKEKFKIMEKGEILLAADSPSSTVKSMALALNFFAEVFSRRKIDLLFVLGDRFEMHAAALAALPFNIPVAHIHGGELTYGAIDDSLRHSITKLSHLHFVSTGEYRNRVIQLGENPENVIISGAPSLDNLKEIKILSKSEIEKKLNINLKKRFFLVTLHPETVGKVDNRKNAQTMFKALREFDVQLIVTLPNADPGNSEIREVILSEVKRNKNLIFFENLGTQNYFSLMSLAEAVIGNSSSGIIESASFKLPAINIGKRQEGRVRNTNVIDCDFGEQQIVNSVNFATSSEFKEKLKNCKNIYGDGNAAKIIVRFIESRLEKGIKTQKAFYDLKGDKII